MLNFLSGISTDSSITDATWLDSMQSDTTWGDGKHAALMCTLIWHGEMRMHKISHNFSCQQGTASQIGTSLKNCDKNLHYQKSVKCRNVNF